LRGIGVSNATSEIQIDRYSAKSSDGVTVDFIDTTNRFDGWKTIFTKANSWIQYNTVAFGKKKLKSVIVKATTSTGGTLQIHLDNENSHSVSKIEITKTNDWKEIKVPVTKFNSGIHNLIISLKANSNTQVDWIKFE
jgi:hypothetical protein